MSWEHWPRRRAGEVVVMDNNLACQNCPVVLRAIRAAGDRSCQPHWHASGLFHDSINPYECANYLRNVGYVSNLAGRVLTRLRATSVLRKHRTIIVDLWRATLGIQTIRQLECSAVLKIPLVHLQGLCGQQCVNYVLDQYI